MKRTIGFILLLLCVLMVQAQSLAVQSFRLDQTDLTANTAGTIVLDQNGQKCALVKVETTQTGFAFDAGSLGVVKTEQKVGEIWVYVPEGVKRLTISHQQLGVLRDYDLGQTLKRAKTYILKLASGEVQTIIKQSRTSQYVVFQVQPQNAIVMLNGEMLQTIDGVATKMMRFGTYDYRVQAPDYLPEIGKVTVDDPKQKHVVGITLKPNFSQVTLSVDNNAEIWVNGEQKGTGQWSGNLGAGTYEFETRLASHRPAVTTRDIAVSAEPLSIRLNAPTPIYGDADINSTPAMADIFIDGQKRGQTPLLIERLLIGQHQLRLSREGYADYNGTVTIQEGETANVSATLSNATTITISSTNPAAQLYIDGEALGIASGQKQVSFGEHQVRLVAEGWQEYTGTINVTDQQLAFSLPMEKIAPSQRTFTVDSVQFTMIHVEGGTFNMGATFEQGGDIGVDEKPVHKVTLSSYFIGETEVTQELWQAVMGSNPSDFKGSKLPVEKVSWEDCQKFIEELNKKTGMQFRLPTEAEWEFAARGGKMSQGYKYSGSNKIGDVAWFKNNSANSTHDVKTKQPNELGIYDMSGNVWEWCQDWYGSYDSAPQTNPTGASSGVVRMYRGGGWRYDAASCRVAYRDYTAPADCYDYLGLRLAF